ncbi:MAG TPA: lysophospholipid acyltransferase family protein [Candidatus Dormibacteraeota bacterium]
MSSTESSAGSSDADPALPVVATQPADLPGELERPPEPGPSGGLYQGPEYRQAVGAGRQPAPPFEELAHPEPYDPPWLYRLAVTVVRFLVFTLFRTRVEGLENLPPPPFIIAANHQAWFDTAFIVAVFPRRPMVYTMARRDTVFNRRWKRRLVPRFGVFPIQPLRGDLDERGVATVYQVLRRGGNILIFPEGHYSRGRALKPLKKGVAHFALQAGVPICPVAITGIDRLRPFGEVTVSIGPPIRPDPPSWWEVNRRVQRILESVRTGILHAFGRPAQARRPGWMSGLFRGLLRRRGGDTESPGSYDRGGSP